MTNISLITAVAISFVSFQGWQLVMYDQDDIKNAASNVPKAVYISIVGAIVVDSMIAILVTSLVPTQVIAQHPEIAVARAVDPFLGQIGFVAVAIAALFSTGSAINGTLFSAANFAKGMDFGWSAPRGGRRFGRQRRADAHCPRVGGRCRGVHGVWQSQRHHVLRVACVHGRLRVDELPRLSSPRFKRRLRRDTCP